MVSKRIVFLVLFLVLVSIGYRKYTTSGDTKLVDSKQDLEVSTREGKSKPFEEMTIPYLRSRVYQGIVGEKSLYQEKGEYKSYITSYVSDGLKVNGLLAVPKGESPERGWPAVVFVHGYIPPSLYKTTEKYVDYVDYLAKNGVVVFKIDLRGHGDSEGEPGGAYYSSDYVIDVLNAYEALRKLDGVNSEQVGLWGHSMAGNVLFRAAVVKKDIPKVVIWAGAVYSYADMAKYGIQDNSYRPAGMTVARQKKRQELFDTYGQFDESSDFWKQVSGLNYLSGVRTKFSLHHATDDNVVNVGYSRDLLEELKKRGVESELFEYKTGGHNIGGSSFGQAMKQTVDFFKN